MPAGEAEIAWEAVGERENNRCCSEENKSHEESAMDRRAGRGDDAGCRRFCATRTGHAGRSGASGRATAGQPQDRAGEGGGGLSGSHQRGQRRRRFGAYLCGRARRARANRPQGRHRAEGALSRSDKYQSAGQRRSDRIRRAGALLDRVSPAFSRERLFLCALRFAAVQRRRGDRALSGGPGQPRPHDPRAHQSDRQGAHAHSAALLQPQRRADRVRPRWVPLHRQR